MVKTVFVLGELNPDVILSAEDIVPEPNMEKWIDRYEIVLGSSSAITAVRLAGLGHKVFFVSLIGDDDFGHFCKDQLERHGVDTTYVIVDQTMKTGVTFSLSGAGDRSLLTYKGAISQLTASRIPQELYNTADHIHFGSYFLQEGMKEHWPAIFKQAHARGISTSFDTGWDPVKRWDRGAISELLEHTDLFIPSEEEAKHIFDIQSINDMPQALPPLFHTVAVKQGREGAVMYSRQDGFSHSPAYRVIPVDTTGAGDSFNAGLISSFLAKKSRKDMLEFANACGALSTLAIGGTLNLITEDIVGEFMSNQHR